MVVALAAAGCTKPQAAAFQVQNRSQLIGGQDALGDIGDFKLSNGKVQFIVQGIKGKTNVSRGWGPYAGSLLDADLIRPGVSTASIPTGHDHFGEMFAGFFVEAISPKTVAVGNDGSDGQPATVIVKGAGGPFLTEATQLLQGAGLDGNELERAASSPPTESSSRPSTASDRPTSI